MVDDEEILRLMAQDMLEPLGYELLLAPDGASGVALYEQEWERVDLVILDLVMPKMNGVEAYRAICRINPKVKVLFASGYDLTDEGSALLTETGQGFIQKPFHQALLAQRVAHVLEVD